MTAEEAITIITGAQVVVTNRDPDKFVAAIDRALISLRLEKQPKEVAIEKSNQNRLQNIPQPLTFADQIRAMTDYELAEWFHDIYRRIVEGTMDDISCLFCDGKAGCITKEGDIICNPENEKACVLRWLQQPAKEEL